MFSCLRLKEKNLPLQVKGTKTISVLPWTWQAYDWEEGPPVSEPTCFTLVVFLDSPPAFMLKSLHHSHRLSMLIAWWQVVARLRRVTAYCKTINTFFITVISCIMKYGKSSTDTKILLIGWVQQMSRLRTKPTKWHVCPAKTQISLGIRPVRWVFAVRMMPSLIWVFTGHTCHFVGFVMRRIKYFP